MRGHNASLVSKSVTLPADQSWVKILDSNAGRMYLCIQNDHDNHSITIKQRSYSAANGTMC